MNPLQGARGARLRSVVLRAAFVLVALALPIAAVGQGVTGTLSGTVKDTQGGVIPGASVTVINEAQGTRSAPVITNDAGDFVLPNLAAGTYTVLVEMPQFKTLTRPGVVVNSGSRVSVGALAIEIGGTSETVTVTTEVPLVQATSGERSFSVTTESVANLPLQNRSYFGLLALAPGVVPASGNTVVTRLGGGGGNNYMIDGTNTMDPSVNRPSQTVSVEAIEEVRVQTSSYSAEYGRASGVQINAVTKSGTNQFHGAIYDVERHSRFNANTQENILTNSPKTLQSQRDYGVSLGGPVGRPGGNNKLFFYLNYERNPREFSKNEINRYRVPTLLERQGDFSQSLDNNGNLYPYIRDYLKTGTCSAASQTACFADGGVVGRIPADRLYSTGLAILRWWPAPNLPSTPGVAYNYQSVYPGVNRVGYQPLIKIDYQPFTNLRGSYRNLSYRQAEEVTPGTIPGWNDTIWFDTGPRAQSASINWTVNNQTFVEGGWGSNWVRQRGGGGLVQGAPRLSRGGNPVNATANIQVAGFGDLPRIYPDQWIPEPGTLWEQGTLKGAEMGATQWDGTRIQTAPRFIWGSRVNPPPPDLIMPDDLESDTWTLTATLTRVQGSHTLKAGYFHYSTRHPQSNFDNQGITFGQDANNIFDTTFGFANAATGVYSTYVQNPRVEEGVFRAFNREAFVQDNWKVRNNLTFDYGVRLVNISQVWDDRFKTSNFLPDRWSASAAPVLYKAGCSTGVYPCAAAARVALNPVTGQLLGVNSAQLVGTRVPGTGNPLNGVFAAGDGIDEKLYLYPALKVAPRTGFAWDIRGNQTMVFRGGLGVFYDRTNISQFYDSVKNPPFSQQTTMRYGLLQTLSASVAPSPSSALWATQYDQPLPISTQWNSGIQVAVPFSMVVDFAYTGQHSENGQTTVNINAIDLGAGYLPQNQNPAAANAANLTDPATSYAATNPDVVRFYQGYGAISQRQQILNRTYHSLQVSVNRRFKNGLAFGFYDTIGLYDKQNAPPRLQHNADGSVTVRADQARADELLGNQNPQEHLLRANFTWRLPTMTANGGGSRALAALVNGWSLSGIWNGATGPYYSVTASYQNGGGNLNLTGSPDYAARVVVLPNVDPGGCSSDPIHQFNTSAFRGPAPRSDGLESGNGYLKGCFISSMDLAIARSIHLRGGQVIELRADVFNAFNQAGITGRNTTMNLTSPADPVTITNLPIPETGVRTLPVGAGFGVANAYQAPRSAQLQFRFAF